MKEVREFTAKEVLEALSISEMAEELGITSQGMTYTATTAMFVKNVRIVDVRDRRRTYHRGDFRRYKKLRERVAAAKSGE